MGHPLADASGLVWRRPWALLPLVLIWAESFVSWPLAAGLRGTLGALHWRWGFPGIPESGVLDLAMDSGAVAMLPSARSGWVSAAIPVMAAAGVLGLALTPRGRAVDPRERSLLMALCGAGLLASLAAALGQMVVSRAGIERGVWDLFQMSGAVLRAVVVPATFGVAALWWVCHGAAGADRLATLTRLAVTSAIGAVLLGMPSILREGPGLGALGHAWIVAMPVMGIAAVLLAGWALRPVPVTAWLERPTVVVAVVGIAGLQVGLATLRLAWPPVEVVYGDSSAVGQNGYVYAGAWLLSVAVAAAHVALGAIAVAAVALCGPAAPKGVRPGAAR